MEGRAEVERSLHDAAILGKVDLLDQVLEKDPLILKRLSVGSMVHTPLHVAASKGHLEFVQRLLSENPDLASVLNQRRWSALHVAVTQGHGSIVEELVQANSHMCTALDVDGRNPLHLAAINGDTDVLITFLKVQFHMIPELFGIRDVNGDTLLHLAVKNCQFETLELLLLVKRAIEASPINAEQARIIERALNTINNSGFTPLDILAQTGTSGFTPPNVPVETNWRKHKIEYILRAAGCFKAREIGQGEWLSKKRESLMVVASLIATMTFQAALSPPGGYWQDNKEEHKAGENVMAFNRPTTYSLFLFANSMGFFGSVMTILLLVTGLSFKNSLHIWFLVLVMLLTVVSTVVAYTLTILATTSKKDRQRLTDCVVIVGWTWCVIILVLFLARPIWFIYGWLFTMIKTQNERMKAKEEAKLKQERLTRIL